MISIKVFIRESNQTWSSVIRKENEDIISISWLKNFFSSFAFHECFVAFQDSLKNLGGNMSLWVVNLDSCINIYSWLFVCRLIKDFAFEGIS